MGGTDSREETVKMAKQERKETKENMVTRERREIVER